ncbi:pulmonary surfactant-associated protein D-like isoform X3 [Alligator sinensis]|uniref:Pulmonary surfactant-associated protein D-like isoform X3 n=1 Tax=Alligator sinensis TaxID=38654 RepID=A0A3Q0HGI2_ALLSI|nr:pulmonary surfactant-associated protein D-like isoform X3 [Alligator sinensis]
MLLLPTLSTIVMGIFLVTMAVANPTQVGKNLDPNACALGVCRPAQNRSLTGDGKEGPKGEKKHPGLEEATSFQDLPRSTTYIEPKGNKSSVEKEAKGSRVGLQGTKSLQNPEGKLGFPMPKEDTSSQAKSGMKVSARFLDKCFIWKGS